MSTKDKNNKIITNNDEKLAKNLAKYDKNIKIFKILASIFFVGIILVFGISIIFGSQISTALSRAFSSANTVDLDGKMSVHYVDVGQALGVVVKFNNGKVAVIDTGSADTATDFCNYIKNKIFAHERTRVIDYLILTHSDSDHSGGAVKILDAFEVKNIYRPNIYASFENVGGLVDASDTWYHTVRAIDREHSSGANVFYNAEGIRIDVGDASIRFFGPIHNSYPETNMYSPIIRLEYAGFSHLLTGDATADNEAEVLASFATELASDVLCVGHHGSNTSTSLDFVQAVQPKYAIISVGENTYGHPSEIIMHNLYIGGVTADTLYRTDVDGDVVFVTNCESTNVYTGGIKIPVRIDWTLVAIVVMLWGATSEVIVWTKLDKKNIKNQKT